MPYYEFTIVLFANTIPIKIEKDTVTNFKYLFERQKDEQINPEE